MHPDILYSVKANEKLMALSDEYLLEGCLKRDDRCREALYRKYSKDLYQFALRYASNKEEAEDVLQEAFLAIFERIGQYRKEGSLLAWMRTIVIREAICQYQRNLKRKQRERPLSEEHPENSEEGAVMPYDEVDYHTLLQLIQELPDGFRVVFNLCEIEGYSYQEAAEMLQCSQATCRSQLMRAKSKLRKRIMALEHDEQQNK